MFDLLKKDEWLKPYAPTIEKRYNYIQDKRETLTSADAVLLKDFATGHKYFGLHKTKEAWVLRDWITNVKAVYLIGDFNGWRKEEAYKFLPNNDNQWELKLPLDKLKHHDLYKFVVEWDGGEGERIPAWATRVVQDETTKIFSAQVWDPVEPYQPIAANHKPNTDPLLIYECHVGMAGEKEGVSSYLEFAENVLPRIQYLGYNAIQLMAIQEHPYYGSYGYHVSSFFAASSRFGTPDELKYLIDKAHQMGITVIMDIVHSHAVKNELEGLGGYNGSHEQFFYPGDRGVHPQWDSFLFDYGKNEVLHFLLSNCRYWLEEYHFDGFRFDGVTSMLYHDHGLGKAFTSYDDYYGNNQNIDAITYLALANEVIHQFKPNAISIAEEMSGMPGLALPSKSGGYGFDYRMAMNIPDYWIKTIKEKEDQNWQPSDIFWQLTNRRAEEKTISYAESHDQAMVGDKTLIFRLIDADMYWHMSKLFDSSFRTDRGIALSKMIKLITLSTINGGYLNFIGNEFGHPEWIDFPREGNGWSYKYARRQWHLIDDTSLKYHYLNDFDQAMIALVKSEKAFEKLPIVKVWDKNDDQILAYMRGDLLFIYNFNPITSFDDYSVIAPVGKYLMQLNSDSLRYGGNEFIDPSIEHFTIEDKLYSEDNKGILKLYIPARTAFVLKRFD